jgi:hypothetical protein
MPTLEATPRAIASNSAFEPVKLRGQFVVGKPQFLHRPMVFGRKKACGAGDLARGYRKALKFL